MDDQLQRLALCLISGKYLKVSMLSKIYADQECEEGADLATEAEAWCRGIYKKLKGGKMQKDDPEIEWVAKWMRKQMNQSHAPKERNKT